MSPFQSSSLQSNPVLCVGGAHIDRLGRIYGPPVFGTSNRGTIGWGQGGVARNVAENLVRLGCPVTLMSRVGKDDNGREVLDHAGSVGIDTSLVTLSDSCPTGSYTAIIGDDGEMVIALADTEIYRELTPELIESQIGKLRQYSYWFVDGSLADNTLRTLLAAGDKSQICVGAVSPAEARRLRPLLSRIAYLFASVGEGASLAGLDPGQAHDPQHVADRLRDMGCEAGVLTAGHEGIVVWCDGVSSRLPVIKAPIQEVTGAGDSLAAGTIYGLRKGLSLAAAVQWGLAAASVTVESRHTVSNRISLEVLETRMRRASES